MEDGVAAGDVLFTIGTLSATGVVVAGDPEEDGGGDTTDAVGGVTLGVDGDGDDGVVGARGAATTCGEGDGPSPDTGDDAPPLGADVLEVEDRRAPSFGDAMVVGEDGP